MNKNKGKTVLITGCSSGIGKALAKACHEAAYTVIATARKPESLNDLTALGMHCLKLDVNEQSDIDAVGNFIKNDLQGIDFIINNAGIGLMCPMADLNPEDLQQQFNTNLFSMSKLINSLLPIMVAQKSGVIINVGSVSGILTTPFAGAYCASKAAVHAMSEAYRMELAPFGIQVATLQPGAVASAFGDNASEITESLLKEDSLYKPIEKAIRRRAQASQENPTPAEDFAKILLKYMTKKRLPAVIRIGNGSGVLPLLPRLIPAHTLDKLLSKPFKLNQLG
jgi:short-subunit dehydrogenase